MGTPLDRVVGLTRKAAAAYGRPDLVEWIDLVGARPDGVPFAVVVGEFKSGKSSLVNALTVEPVCPAEADRATAVPTVVYFGGPPGARAFAVDGEPGRPVALEDLPDLVTDGTAAWEQTERVDVRLGLLDAPDPFALVDTPGAGGWTSPMGSRAIGWLPLAMTAVVVHDGASPLTVSEIELVELAHRLCPSVAVAITRIDLHPAWRDVVHETETQLAARGLGAIPVWPVSARLGQLDDEAQARSGIDDLLTWMTDATVDEGSPARVATRCRGIVEVLRADLEAERAAHLAPTPAPPADDAAPAPAGPVLPWQTILGDGIADVGNEMDVAWRSAARDLVRRSQAHLEEIDPGRDWATFEQWLRQELIREAAEVFARFQDGIEALTGRLADALAAEAGQLGSETRAADVHALLAAMELEAKLEAGAGLGTRSFAALRGSYSGMALAGMMAGVAGLSLAGPALIVFGVAMGTKTIRDERGKQRDQRRRQAEAAAQRFLDEAATVVHQCLRDALRSSQRDLRDRCLVLASGTEQRRQRTHPGDLTAAERERRVLDLDAELARLAQLRQRIDHLLASEVAPS
jgi:hypothetical protein